MHIGQKYTSKNWPKTTVGFLAVLFGGIAIIVIVGLVVPYLFFTRVLYAVGTDEKQLVLDKAPEYCKELLGTTPDSIKFEQSYENEGGFFHAYLNFTPAQVKEHPLLTKVQTGTPEQIEIGIMFFLGWIGDQPWQKNPENTQEVHESIDSAFGITDTLNELLYSDSLGYEFLTATGKQFTRDLTLGIQLMGAEGKRDILENPGKFKNMSSKDTVDWLDSLSPKAGVEENFTITIPREVPPKAFVKLFVTDKLAVGAVIDDGYSTTYIWDGKAFTKSTEE